MKFFSTVVAALLTSTLLFGQDFPDSKSFRIESDRNSDSQYQMVLNYLPDEGNIITLEFSQTVVDLERRKLSSYNVGKITETQDAKTYWLKDGIEDDFFPMAVTVRKDFMEFSLEYYVREPSTAYQEKGDLYGHVTYYNRLNP